MAWEAKAEPEAAKAEDVENYNISRSWGHSLGHWSAGNEGCTGISVSINK